MNKFEGFNKDEGGFSKIEVMEGESKEIQSGEKLEVGLARGSSFRVLSGGFLKIDKAVGSAIFVSAGGKFELGENQGSAIKVAPEGEYILMENSADNNAQENLNEEIEENLEPRIKETEVEEELVEREDTEEPKEQEAVTEEDIKKTENKYPCGKCGRLIRVEARFCPWCGVEIDESPKNQLDFEQEEPLEKEERPESDIEATLQKLKDQIEEKGIHSNATPEEIDKAMGQLKTLENTIGRMGKASKMENWRSEIRQEMIEQLGENYESKIKDFISGLEIREGLIIRSLIDNTLPDIGRAIDWGVLKDQFEEVFERCVKQNPDHLVKLYKAWSGSITRGLGTMVIDPETNQKVKVGEENWYLGPRGQWYKEFEEPFNSLLGKIKALKS